MNRAQRRAAQRASRSRSAPPGRPAFKVPADLPAPDSDAAAQLFDRAWSASAEAARTVLAAYLDVPVRGRLGDAVVGGVHNPAYRAWFAAQQRRHQR